MIREIIRPQQNQIKVEIPNSYIDKELELIIAALKKDDNKITVSKNNITNSLFGILKSINLDENDYKQYLENKYL